MFLSSSWLVVSKEVTQSYILYFKVEVRINAHYALLMLQYIQIQPQQPK